tara:strand:+ start:6721 stop:7053 length:333 start_codon:yes stop_codon:yes gene_type:complete
MEMPSLPEAWQCTFTVEAIDKEGGTAFAVGVRKEVECLQACWIGEVRCVSVSFERDVSVRGVLRGEVGSEVVEPAVVGFADEGDAFEQGFGGGRVGVRDRVDVAEAVCAL